MKHLVIFIVLAFHHQSILETLNSQESGPRHDNTSLRPKNRPAATAPPIVNHAPNPTVVRICYTLDDVVKKGCEKLDEQLRNCGLKVLSIFDKSPTEIGEVLKKQKPKLPPNTNVLVSAHGVMYQGDHVLGAGKGIGKNPEEDGKRVRLPNGEIVPTILYTKEIINAISSSLKTSSTVTPSFWMSTCHSGAACKKNNGCVGAACHAHEVALMNTATGLEKTEEYITTLLCDGKKFQNLDANRNGVLETEELYNGFCTQFGQGALIKKQLFYEPLPSPNSALKFPPGAMTVKNEPDFQILVNQERRKLGAQEKVSGRKAGKLYIIEYEDEFGKKQQSKNVMWSDDFQNIEELLKATAQKWPDDCSVLIDQPLTDKPKIYKNCSVAPITDAYIIEWKDNSNNVCINSSTEGTAQHLQLNNFRLYSPYETNKL